MKIILESEDFLKAFTPFFNGCDFKMIMKQNGDVFCDIGCYLLINLLNGAEKYLFEKYKENGDKPFKINIPVEVRVEILKQPPCRHCGGTLFQAKPDPPSNHNTLKYLKIP